jgi:hypothetical protein
MTEREEEEDVLAPSSDLIGASVISSLVLRVFLS